MSEALPVVIPGALALLRLQKSHDLPATVMRDYLMQYGIWARILIV
ncbi:MAG: hypothetical protein ACTJLK_00965 [Anaplasma sp.]